MERRKSNHTKRIREAMSTLPDIERDLLAANEDGKVLERLVRKLEDKVSTLETELEDTQTKLEDAESELEELRGFYLVQMPDSLTALMELEDRIG